MQIVAEPFVNTLLLRCQQINEECKQIAQEALDTLNTKITHGYNRW